MNKTRWAIAASLLVTACAVPLLMLEQADREDQMQMERALAGAQKSVQRIDRSGTVQGGRAPSPEMVDALTQADMPRIARSGPMPRQPMSPPPPQQMAQAPNPSALAQLANPSAMTRALSEATRMGTAQLSASPLPGFVPSDASRLTLPEPVGRDAFTGTEENPYRSVREQPVSTFSLDVDTASYSFVRASLARNVLPPKAAVRTEELVNYFPYDYPAPTDPREPFKATVSVVPSPWHADRRLVHVGIRGYAVRPAERPKANLVFLVDTSGSMDAPNRLPLAKQALSMLVGQLEAGDTVAIVTYAGSAGTVLEPTPASRKATILAAIERLGAGGGTAGAEGIRQAYTLAEAHYDPKAVNRVMLATDGDFNVGITSPDELKGFVERKRESGIFLSVLGFGMGNYNDALMQALAQNGNGVAAYIDTLAEARKTLVEEATSSIVPIARDVKVQFEFNPAKVSEYRLVGYETRALRREDFANDKVDAGDVGSGHTVTAIYEIVPAGGAGTAPDLRYAQAAPAAPEGKADELGFLSMRYKLPGEDASRLMTMPVPSKGYDSLDAAPQEARFGIAVAGFGEMLRGGRHTGGLTYADVIAQAQAAKGDDPFGYRSEFVQLVRSARTAAALQRAPR